MLKKRILITHNDRDLEFMNPRYEPKTFVGVDVKTLSPSSDENRRVLKSAGIELSEA